MNSYKVPNLLSLCFSYMIYINLHIFYTINALWKINTKDLIVSLFHTLPLETCPGVCVAERLSGFCEAILNIQGLCKDSLRCCVAKQIFNGNYPPELIIPSGGEIPDLPTPLPQRATTTTRRTTTTTRYNWRAYCWHYIIILYIFQ